MLSTSRFAAVTVAIAACAAAPAAMAAIVVASSGPSAAQYPAGKKLDDNAQVTLRAGDTLTILDARGPRGLRGGGTFSVAPPAAGADRSATFAALTRQRASQRVRTGAVRDPVAPVKVMSPNLWYVDVSQGGTRCLVDPAGVRLWRADASAPASYRIAGAGNAAATVDFAAASMVAGWDAMLPVADGASYAISRTGSAQSVTISFALLPEMPATPEDMARVLIEKGCTTQLDLLAQSMAVPAQ
ncbi:MAG TPA: hypothetical protein PKD92_13265 [Novosphingobium sp.]|nr:hypothetical protein [Novosphingobium sp.]